MPASLAQTADNFVNSGLWVPLLVMGIPASIGVGALIIQAIAHFSRRSGDGE